MYLGQHVVVMKTLHLQLEVVSVEISEGTAEESPVHLIVIGIDVHKITYSCFSNKPWCIYMNGFYLATYQMVVVEALHSQLVVTSVEIHLALGYNVHVGGLVNTLSQWSME